MSHKRSQNISNGDIQTVFYFFECDCCHDEIPDSHPHLLHDNTHICWDCAFKNNLINEKEYLGNCGISVDTARAALDSKTGEIVVVMFGKFPWEKTKGDYRHSIEYTQWRFAVFLRDKFTCQTCKKIGGDIEAHHILTFNKYPSLRFVLTNGITLCKKCHKEKHKKRR